MELGGEMTMGWEMEMARNMHDMGGKWRQEGGGGRRGKETGGWRRRGNWGLEEDGDVKGTHA